jgi:hypothetical protein
MIQNLIRVTTFYLAMFIFGVSAFASNKDSLAEKNEYQIGLTDALAATGIYYGASIYILNNTWYKERRTVAFHFYDDSKAYMQVDKLGHAFGSYFYSYIGLSGLKYLGFSNQSSLIYGGTLGFVLQLPIEIMDGFHKGWGFSWSDIAANASGSLLVIGQELLFQEQIAKFKFSYWETDYSRKANGYLGDNTLDKILDDYNGHSYWISVPINILTQKSMLPDWLCLSVGYGANGMYGEYENITEYNGVPIPETQRYRQYFFSLDIDWTKIKTDSPILNVILKGLTFIKLPFPTIEYNSLGNFQYHWLHY